MKSFYEREKNLIISKYFFENKNNNTKAKFSSFEFFYSATMQDPFISESKDFLIKCELTIYIVRKIFVVVFQNRINLALKERKYEKTFEIDFNIVL